MPFVIDLANLAPATGFVIQGDAAGDNTGVSVASAGDVNGDGIDDLIIGADGGDDGGYQAGEAYVVYGRTGATRGRLDLTNLAARDGFVIQGDAADEFAGSSVAGAGDVNGDGLADLIVGAPRAADGGFEFGAAYVIYGQTGTTRGRVDLTNLAARDGFTVFGAGVGDEAGRSVASAGDVNGDGIDDVIIGAPDNDNQDGFVDDAGAAYVIYGRLGAARSGLDLLFLGARDGFRIQGNFEDYATGFEVASAGDVNGDGLADLIVGERGGSGSAAGTAYVIYGQSGATRGTVNLSGLTAPTGFVISGDASDDGAGRSVASAGDVNGDGIDDLIVGAPFGDDGGNEAGEAYVVYGRSGTTRGRLDLTNLTAADGYVIQGDAAYDRAGFSVASAGDVNGDGLDDLIVGTLGSFRAPTAGAAYVLFGQTGTTRVRLDLSDLARTDGFVLRGDAEFDQAGASVAAAGDVNGDGFDDLIIGAPTGDDGGFNAGEAYVIYGGRNLVPADRPLGAVTDANAAANRVAENAAPGALAGLTARAVDPDAGDRVTYALTDSAQGRFAINASTGVVSVAGGLDFETARSHQITVLASSTGGDSRSATFTIAVSNADDPLGPLRDLSTLANVVAESAAPGARVNLTARAIDPDTGDRVSYALTDSAGGRFAIDSRTGVVTVAAPLDFESARSHQITVLATSSGGDFRSALFTIAVRNADDPLGAISDVATLANIVAESAAPGARVNLTARAIDPDTGDRVSYTLTDSAQGRFAIDASTGVVTVAAPLDFETARSHQITVLATSTGGDDQSASFTIAVRNADDPLGAISDVATLANIVAESAAPGARVNLTARAIDPDTGDRVSYTLTDSAQGRFAIDASTGVVTVAAPLDFETARSHQITVLATSTGGDDQSASFTIAVRNADDPLGAISDVATLANIVAESAAPGARVNLTARAIDPDTGDRVSYTLTDSAQGRFAIDASTGVVTVAAPLDFETARSHQITVLATSTGGDDQSASFTIAVRNVPEALRLRGTPAADTLTGTAGDDTFIPGAGSDTLTGRGGNDVFIFTTETRNGASERDTITDFAPGDRLDLRDAQILREVQVSDTTVLTLDGDRDQIRLTGLSDFDPDTMLV